MNKNKELEDIIQEYSAFGFDPNDIIMAWISSNQRPSLVLDKLIDLNKNTSLAASFRGDNKLLTQSSQNFEEQTMRAIALSIEEDAKALTPDLILRAPDTLVGLKNIGNTCYFNALIQQLFQIEEFVQILLGFCPPFNIEKAVDELNLTDPVIVQRKKDSVKLIIELQKLAALMFFGNKNVLDPSDAMKSIIDSQGRKVKIGEQSDISEFSINLFERIEEGLAFDSRPKSDKEENTSINDLFFGKSKDFITFEWSDFKSKKSQDSVYGPINLNIGNQDLMSALDSYTNFTVDGYQAPTGQITTAKKRIWITKPSKVLNFVLERLQYDREKGLTKVTDPFNFTKEIYIDRFEYAYKKSLNNMIEEKKALKTREKKIDQEMAKLQAFGTTNISLNEILENTRKFLAQQVQEMEKDFVEVNSDSAEEKVEDCSTAVELKNFCGILKQYQENVLKKQNNLEKKKEYVKKKIETAFQDLQNVKYTLHSVVVHEGGPNSGHYINFNYNSTTKTWKKYNDSKITDVTEEEVFKSAIGGPNEKNSCAYSLFYVKDDCKVVNFEATTLEKYRGLLPKEMQEYVEEENSKFLMEYNHHKGHMGAKIYEDYIDTMRTISAEASKIQAEIRGSIYPFIPTIVNFNTFLLHDMPRCAEIVRWNTLKAILMEEKVPYKILEGESNNFYYQELKELLVNPQCHYALKTMELSDANKELLATKKREFIEIEKALAIIKRIFGLINDKKWKETMATIGLLHEKLTNLKKDKDSPAPFQPFASHLLTVMSLRFCALIDTYCMKEDSTEALKILEIMIYSLNNKNAIKPSSIVYQQICSNLYYTINEIAREHIKPDDRIIFTHLVGKIETRQEYLPSIDIQSLIPAELFAVLINIENNEGQFYVLEKQKADEIGQSYQKVTSERLQLWVDIEKHLRQYNNLYNQEQRIEKEMLTWVIE